MPDVFDQLDEEKKRDIFDDLESEPASDYYKGVGNVEFQRGSFGSIARPLEREPATFVEPPPMPPQGKPEVLVEGSTRATIPASLDTPEPARAIAPFSMDEFSRGDVATPEERAFTAAQPSEFDRPVIPPSLFKTALDIGSATLPPNEILEGFKKGTAEQLSGMTTQTSAATLPAFMIPYVGPALAMGMGAKAIGTGAGTAVGGAESGNLEEVGQGLSEVAGGTLMAAAPALHGMAPKRPAIPPQFIETLRRVDAVVPDALPRAKEAAIKKVADNAATIEVEAKVEPVGERPGGTPPREAPPAPAPVEAKADTLTADVAREQTIAAEKKALLDSEDIMTLGENPRWMELSKEFEGIKNRYQGRKPSDVVAEQPKSGTILTELEKSTAAKAENEIGPRIAKLPEAERATALAEMDKRYSELSAQAKTLNERADILSDPAAIDAAISESSKLSTQANVIKSAADVARGKAKPGVFNEKAIPAAPEATPATAADQTPIPARQAPVVEPGVGAVPENVSGAGARAKASSTTAIGIPLTFEQFKNAPREGKLLEELRKLPKAPKTPEQIAASERFETAAEAVNKAGLAWIFDRVEPSKRRMVEASLRRLPKTKQKIVNEYESALNDQVKSSGSTDAGQRRLYDRAVEAGIISDPARAAAFFERESEAAGLGRSSLPPTVADVRAQRARDAATPDAIETQPLDSASGAPVPAKVPETTGTNAKMRKSAARATTAPEIPKPVQERIEAAPESRYTQQSMARVEDAVKAMPDAELAAIPADSNLYVASKLEQADRRFRAGDNDAGYAIFVELEKQGTSFGQNINQFKRLAATKPEFVATVIDKKLTKAGKDPLTPAQRTQAIETTRKAKTADLALDKSTDAWTKNPTAENAAKAEAALDKANAEAVELQKFVAKFEPRSTSGVLKSVLQGNLLTPISEVANLFGNMSFLPFRALDRAVGTGLDIIDSAVRGKPRELSVQPLAGTAEALKGVGRGLKQIPDILIEGTGNVIKGETRAGLHPIKAWINQFAKNPEMPTTSGKLTLKDRLNLAIEGTFGVPAEAMLRGLGAGDVPFKEGARARVTAEQLKLNNVPREQWGFAQKFPELFLPKEALQQIHKDTMAAVFQRESKTLNLMTNWLKGKGEVLDFVAATVAPYKLTPWNIVGEILSYNPLVAMTRGVYDASKGNTRAAKLNAGKMVVGSMLTGTGIWLYKNGLLAPSLDERDEAQKARVLSGKVLPPNHINISGLKRATAGGDPAFKAGDETVDVFRAGGLAGAMFYMTANIGRDMERGPTATDGDMWMNIIRQSTLEQARFGLNQSFLSGVDGLLTAIKEGNADNYLRQWANTVGSIPLPNTLNTVSRTMRKYQVDTKADDFKDKIGNMVKTKLGFAGLDDYLPLKRDFWGKPMLETPEGRDAIFYHFFDISKNKQVTSDPVELELYRLWRKTGDTAVIPSLPQRDVTFARTGYALNPQQYERYAELVGENRRNIVDALAVNPQFHKLDDEQKIKLLERVYRDGMERGKALFYREFNGQLTPKQGRAGFPP